MQILPKILKVEHVQYANCLMISSSKTSSWWCFETTFAILKRAMSFTVLSSIDSRFWRKLCSQNRLNKVRLLSNRFIKPQLLTLTTITSDSIWRKSSTKIDSPSMLTLRKRIFLYPSSSTIENCSSWIQLGVNTVSTMPLLIWGYIIKAMTH
jgi:hypothetical protein